MSYLCHSTMNRYSNYSLRIIPQRVIIFAIVASFYETGIQNHMGGTSLVVQGLRPCDPAAWDPGSIPSKGTKDPTYRN